MKSLFLSLTFCLTLEAFAADPALPSEATLPEKIQGSENKVTIRIAVDELKLRSFLTWAEGGHLAVDGKIVPLVTALSQSLEDSQLAACRIANQAVSLADRMDQQFKVVRIEEDRKGIPKIELHTGSFSLICTKLEVGGGFQWSDLVKATRGFLKFHSQY